MHVDDGRAHPEPDSSANAKPYGIANPEPYRIADGKPVPEPHHITNTEPLGIANAKPVHFTDACTDAEPDPGTHTYTVRRKRGKRHCRLFLRLQRGALAGADVVAQHRRLTHRWRRRPGAPRGVPQRMGHSVRR